MPRRWPNALVGGFPARTIIYLCGRVRFPAFEERLQAAGVGVRAVETYDTVALDYSDEAILARLSGQPVDAVLLYSAKAAAAMQVLIGRPALRDLFERTCVFALVRTYRRSLGRCRERRKSVLRRSPHEEALLALLR